LAFDALSGTRLARRYGVDPNHFPMKRILLALLFSAMLCLVSFSRAQMPDANQEQKLLALIKEVQTQQAQLAANQAKIEEKLAAVSETIRTARIYTKRER
jgi:septal ring factor EnvC (AmiA/AmiB activator)